MQTPEPFFSHLGELVISATLAVIGWVMAVFTKRHIESMDRLAEKLEGIRGDVSDIRGDIKVLKDQAERTDERLQRLEDTR